MLLSLTQLGMQLSQMSPLTMPLTLAEQEYVGPLADSWRPVVEKLEERRLFAVTITGDVTLDESAGLQTSGTPIANVEDFNDQDVTLATLQSQASGFYNRLFGSPTAGLGLSTTFPTQIGVAKSANDYITVTASGTITSLGFSKADGTALPVYAGVASGGVSSGLSAATGGAISLFADSSLGNRMVLGIDTNNDKVFALFMQPVTALTSAKVWTVQFEPLANPDTTNFDDAVTVGGLGVAAGTSIQFDFDELHSGSNLFGCVGDATNSLLVIAEHPQLKADGTLDTAGQEVKTSQGGTGATIGIESQMIDPGEGAFFTYVKGSDTNFLAANLSQGEADNSASIQYSNGTLAATSASVTISQTQGPNPGTMQISTFDVAGSPQQKAFVDGINTAGAAGIGAPISITSITIFKANGTSETETAAGPNTSANISFASGVATVSGLGGGDRIEWTTSATHDRVLIKGVAGKFDVGAFAVNEPNSLLAPLTGVRFEDDGPAVTGQGTLVTLTVDETDLTTNATANGANFITFDPVFGQDGSGNTTVSFALALANPAPASGLVDTASGQTVNLSLTGGGVLEGRTATSNALVFTVSVNSSGVITLDQIRAIVHPNTNSNDESKSLTLTNLLSATATTTDKDGDQKQATVGDDVTLVFKDDGPSITATIIGAPTLTVDESDFPTDDSDSFAAQFSPVFGADGQGTTPVSYALSTPGGASGLTDTASGQAVNLSLTGGGVVEGRTATSGVLVFTVSVNSSTGLVTLDQKRSVVHANTSDPDDSRTLTAANLVVLTATANDGDGDHASTPLNIGQQLVFEDDGPAIGPIENSIVDFIAGSTATKTLSGVVGADGKTAPYTIDSFTTTVTINGVELHGIASANNTVVTYYADTSGNGTFGDTGDTAFYKLELSQTANSGAGSYTFTVLVNPPPSLLHFDFDELHSGSNLFGCVGDATNSLIVIAEKPVLKADGTLTSSPNGVVKTSQGGTGATIGINSQMIDPNEGAFFTYVKGSDPTVLAANLDQGEANDSAAIRYNNGTLAATSASVTISQTQGPTAGTMQISAFDVAGSPQQKAFVDGINTAGAAGIGAPVSITSITIHKANGTSETETAAGPNTSANISFASGVATVSGLGGGDRIEWTTSATHDRVLIKGVAGKFDVGAFDITQAQPTPDQKLDFVAKVTDGDGDSNTAGFSIGIDGTGPNDDGIVGGVTVTSLSSLFSSETIDDGSLQALLA